ncbi:hypothetical protein BT96DRAFT_939505 [Gymnopus androsaceus JB14]|uniref:Uncharacterized protein n=1 Tax=Gymnopus androsaceus JB14 TaxID=1447944 RepID=A0A6A4HNP0_9AGAR|nr:hypothetical protein BT96DRAFT_939505 [Gymnopus androsaceus JB14]
MLEAGLGFLAPKSPSLDTPLPNFTTLGVITAGIAPTLFAVQVGLGSSIYNQSSTCSVRPSDLAFATQRRSEGTHVLDMPPIGDGTSLSESVMERGRNQSLTRSRMPEDLEMGSIQVEEKLDCNQAKTVS